MGVAAALSQQTSTETDPSATDDAALIYADAQVISDLFGLESELADIMTNTRKEFKDCDITELQFYLNNLVGVEKFHKCQNIDEVLLKFRREHNNTFNIIYLKQLIRQFHPNSATIQKLEDYEKKIEEFLRATTVNQFQQAVISEAEAVIPKGMAAVTIKILKEYAPRTMEDVEELAKKGFKKHRKTLIKIRVKPGSIIITWLVSEALYKEILQEAREKISLLRDEGVDEVRIEGEKSVILFTQDGHEVRFLISCSSINSHCVIFFKTYRKTQTLMVINQGLHYVHACANIICSYMLCIV